MAKLRTCTLRASVLTSVLLLSSLACGRGTALNRRGGSSDSTEFHHRAYHNSIVVNNNGVPYLYIDGGEITTWSGQGSGLQYTNGSGQARQNFTTIPDRHTYGLSLGEKWTVKDVNLAFIEKNEDYSTFVYEALWPDTDGNTFYSYNGGLSYALQFQGESDPKPNEIWQFTPSPQDGGEWSLATVSPNSNFSLLTRTMGALQTSHEGLNFALGGTESSATDFSWQDRSMDVPGLVMYNESSQEWWNISTSGEGGYTFMGTAREGAAHFVPGFGPKGLLFVFGGFSGDDTLMPFDEAHMFEPVSQQWKTQAVTGTPPAPASGMCVVGVQGDNGTYEIFLHGGITGDTSTTVAQGAVWSLTLPAFHWQQHSANCTYGRFRHSCNTAASDSRQMIVVGGALVTEESTLEAIPRDPWEQGIGVYNLNALAWTVGYSPDMDSYVTPDIIKGYYQENGTYPKTWTDAGVDAWFNPSIAATDGSPQSQSSSSSSSQSSNASDGGDNSPNAGVIAGSVVGAVLGLALIATIIYYLIRRSRKDDSLPHIRTHRFKRRKSKQPEEMDAQWQQVAEMPAEAASKELPAGVASKEMPARNTWFGGAMVSGGESPVHELPSLEGSNENMISHSPPRQPEEWPDEKRGVTAPPSMEPHPAARGGESFVSPV